MSLPAIRNRYGVPASRGREVKFMGRRAVITSARGHHLRLRFDGESQATGVFHPLWEMDYLDDIDHGAAYDERIAAFNAALAAPPSKSKELGDA